MAFARDVYTASAAQTDFTISFSYLDDAHIVVTKDGVTLTEVTDYTFPNATTVRLVVAATGGETIVLTRSSSQSTRLVDYTAGVLVENDLDTDSLQAFYMSQEAIDQVSQSLGKNTSEIWDAEGDRITNLGTPSSSTDAVTKAYADALTTANGNVPTPGNPGEDNYLLEASGGSFAWQSPANVKTNLSLGALADLNTVDTAQIDASAVETAKINDDAVTLAKMEHGTSGDILYYGASGVPTRLAKGTDDQVLTLASGLPSWSDSSGGWESVSTITPTAGVDNSLSFTGLDTDNYVHIVTYTNVGTTANTGYSLRCRLTNAGTQVTTNYDYAGIYINVNDNNLYRQTAENATYLRSPDGSALYYDGGTVNGYQMFWMDADSQEAFCQGRSVSMYHNSSRGHDTSLCLNDYAWTDFDGIYFDLTGSTFASGTFVLKRKPISDLSGLELFQWS